MCKCIWMEVDMWSTSWMNAWVYCVNPMNNKLIILSRINVWKSYMFKNQYFILFYFFLVCPGLINVLAKIISFCSITKGNTWYISDVHQIQFKTIKIHFLYSLDTIFIWGRLYTPHSLLYTLHLLNTPTWNYFNPTNF